MADLRGLYPLYWQESHAAQKRPRFVLFNRLSDGGGHISVPRRRIHGLSLYANSSSWYVCDQNHISFLAGLKTVVNFRPDGLAWPRRRASVTHNVLAPRSFRSEVFWHGR